MWIFLVLCALVAFTKAQECVDDPNALISPALRVRGVFSCYDLERSDCELFKETRTKCCATCTLLELEDATAPRKVSRISSPVVISQPTRQRVDWAKRKLVKVAPPSLKPATKEETVPSVPSVVNVPTISLDLDNLPGARPKPAPEAPAEDWLEWALENEEIYPEYPAETWLNWAIAEQQIASTTTPPPKPTKAPELERAFAIENDKEEKISEVLQLPQGLNVPQPAVVHVPVQQNGQGQLYYIIAQPPRRQPPGGLLGRVLRGASNLVRNVGTTLTKALNV